MPGSSENEDFFGSAVAAGDVNGDGYADLAVGARGEDFGTKRSAGVVSWLPARAPLAFRQRAGADRLHLVRALDSIRGTAGARVPTAAGPAYVDVRMFFTLPLIVLFS